MAFTLGVAAVAAALLLIGIAPKLLIRRGQDRLARELLARDGERDRYQLLTRAEKFVGTYRRIPGVLGLKCQRLIFESRFAPPLEIPLSGIRKIVTGKVLQSGRRLFRDEVLALTDSAGTLFEFQMSHASCFQWRQHLGAWAAEQKGEQ
jgi:hypothetical protein